MAKSALCIHAHFYQPPRANPLTGDIGTEQSAAPFRNWNERAAEEVYRPNAGLHNFEKISFDIGEALLDWLQFNSKLTYQGILDAVRMNQDRFRHGNVLAVPLHQSPLTALSERDRLTQLRWGAEAARMRFGYVPKGVFLPHFAADLPTLQSVVDAGFKFTLLDETQVDGVPTRRGGSGPYRMSLPSGDSLDVFLVNHDLSASMVRELVERGGAGYWARRKLGSYQRDAGPVTVLYVDGEMLGQHRMAEAYFLYYLLNNEAPAVACHPTTLEVYYDTVKKPVAEIELRSPLVEEDDALEMELMRALNTLTAQADMLLEDALGEKAWMLRDNMLNPDMPLAHSNLLKSQFYLQQARANIAGLDHYPQLSISGIFADVAYALQLIQTDTSTDLSKSFAGELPADLTVKFQSALGTATDKVAVEG